MFISSFRCPEFFVDTYETHETANSKYVLHNHKNVIELLFFIKGNASFYVEGTVYPLSKSDLIVARSDEMHRIIHNGECDYERMVINFSSDFIRDNGLEEYADFIYDRPVGMGNLFPAERLKSDGVLYTIAKLNEYCNANAPESIIKGKLCELIFNLHKVHENISEDMMPSGTLKNIILYINENISKPLSLDILAAKFYLSKYYMCRVFKKHTGMTINKYISQKRILLVRELYVSGKSLTEACLAAGFGDYSSFYTAYRKETGHSPREDLKTERLV